MRVLNEVTQSSEKFSSYVEDGNQPDAPKLAANAFEGLRRKVAVFPDFLWTEVGRFGALPIAQEMLDGVKFMSAGRQVRLIDLTAETFDIVAHPSAFAIDGSTVPDSQQPTSTEESPQLVARAEEEGSRSEAGERRHMLPVTEDQPKNRCLTNRGSKCKSVRSAWAGHSCRLRRSCAAPSGHYIKSRLLGPFPSLDRLRPPCLWAVARRNRVRRTGATDAPC